MATNLEHARLVSCGLALLLLGSASGVAVGQPVGTLAMERRRLREITGDSLLAPAAVPETLSLARSFLGTRLVPIRPSVRVTWNSAIPYSLNDGSLWAGRGSSTSFTAGFETLRDIRGATLRVTVAPLFFYSQNKPFQVIANRTPGRSGWANPFHGAGASL